MGTRIKSIFAQSPTLKTKVLAKQEKLDAGVRKLLVPIKHTIKVEAL